MNSMTPNMTINIDASDPVWHYSCKSLGGLFFGKIKAKSLLFYVMVWHYWLLKLLIFYYENKRKKVSGLKGRIFWNLGVIDLFQLIFTKKTENKLGLSWAKLSIIWDCSLVEICLNRVEISLSKCHNAFLKLTH